MYFCRIPSGIAASAAVIAAGFLAHSDPAHADDHARPAATASAPSADRADRGATPPPPVHVAVLGGFGFPRPLAIDGLVIVREKVAVGVEYGALPPVTIAGVRTSLWSFAADARFFPFRGPFFVGVRAGVQHVEASTNIVVANYGSAPESLTLDSWFINPRLGILWASHAGIAFGTEAGLQIPISPSVTSSLPLSLLPGAQSAANALGSSLLPTVDVLRLGGVL
jgi:hypothetical protein